jgi:hypothetical protein
LKRNLLPLTSPFLTTSIRFRTKKKKSLTSRTTQLNSPKSISLILHVSKNSMAKSLIWTSKSRSPKNYTIWSNLCKTKLTP